VFFFIQRVRRTGRILLVCAMHESSERFFFLSLYSFPAVFLLIFLTHSSTPCDLSSSSPPFLHLFMSFHVTHLEIYTEILLFLFCHVQPPTLTHSYLPIPFIHTFHTEFIISNTFIHLNSIFIFFHSEYIHAFSVMPSLVLSFVEISAREFK